MHGATSRCPLCALLGLLAFSLFGWYVIHMGGARSDRIITQTELLASKALTAAGFPWAQLRIDGDVGHLTGDAPDPEAKIAAFAAATAALQPAMGIPGVFARLEDEVIVNGAAASLPANSERDIHVADMSASLELKAWTEAMPQHFEHEVYYPRQTAAEPAASEGVVNAANDDIAREANAGLGTSQAGLPTGADRSAQVSEREIRYPGAEPSNEMAPGSCEFSISALLDNEPIHFATSSADMDSTNNASLDKIAVMIRACRGFHFTVEGHTDNRGSSAGNQALSEARAQSVRRALMERGIGGSSLQAIGYGETRPLDPANNDEAWARNRRIELHVGGNQRPAGDG